MESSHSPADEPRNPLIKKALALFEVLVVSGLLLRFLAFLPVALIKGMEARPVTNNVTTLSAFLLLESAITFIFLLIILRAHGETVRDLGLSAKHWKKYLLIGLALVPFLFLVNFTVAFVVHTCLPKYYIERNPLTEGINTPLQLALLIFSALIAGGIKEELQRAFILRRFSRYLGGAGFGLVVWSLAFGAQHYLQGLQGIAVAAILGLVFGAMYLLSNSLIAPICAHSAYDVLALLLYWFVLRQS
jgi:membrane protease YdiL (CAAX protease family)